MGLFFVGLGLLKLLVTVFVILLIVKGATYFFASLRERHDGFAAFKAEQILKRRFAEGEIDAAEYRERLKVLREEA